MSDSNLNNILIEEKINLLKKEVDNYNSLSDHDKIKLFNNYNNFINEKEQCNIIIDNYKKKLHTKEENKGTIDYSDETFKVQMERIHEIKSSIDNNNFSLDKLVELYIELNEIICGLDSYFSNKNMEIINLK